MPLKIPTTFQTLPWTDDRVYVEIEEFRFAVVATALGAKLGFCHFQYPSPDGTG
jgi:hypothetical protein